jgi:hypothetical protein
MNTKVTIGIFIVHTILVLFVLNLFSGGEESWPFFGLFFLDFPASVLFHQIVGFFGQDIGYFILLGLHLVLGGLYWWVIVYFINSILKGITSRSSRGR